MRPLNRLLCVTAGLLGALSSQPVFAQMGMSEKLELVSRFDTNGDGWLDARERTAARAALHSGAVSGRYWRGEFDAVSAPGTPGPHLTPSQVKRYDRQPLYDLDTLRTIFITLTDKDWEQELMDFYRTDVDVPATVIVDGKTYRDVGVHFRGMTSFRMVGAGHKHSMDLSFDFLHDQDLLGYHKIELLNSAADPTFLRSALYMYIMRQYVPAPKANYMRVVINGESWGVYVNEEHLTSEFTRDAVGYAKSMRWKVPGSPRARGGLEYMGDDPAPYRRVFEIKSKDKPESWEALIRLCKVLNTTPPQRLPAVLPALLDVDGALRFLAVDKALINNDGYWVRSSDYSVYTDGSGRFHVAPHDANETLRPTEEMMWGGFGVSGQDQIPPNSVQLDPLANANDPTKPLLSRLLAVPAWRQKYLGYVRDIAEHWLDWKQLGPVVQHFQSVIAADVPLDTRKLFSTESFTRAVYEDNAAPVDESPISPPDLGLKNFAEQRRAYLLAWFANQPGAHH